MLLSEENYWSKEIGLKLIVNTIDIYHKENSYVGYYKSIQPPTQISKSQQAVCATMSPTLSHSVDQEKILQESSHVFPVHQLYPFSVMCMYMCVHVCLYYCRG